MIVYKDFSIRIESGGDAGIVIKAESNMGDGSGIMALPDDVETIARQLQQFTSTVRSAGAADDTLRQATFEAEPPAPPSEIGGNLFKAMFNGSVASKYYECCGSMSDGEGLRIKLYFDFNDPEERKLALVPWEYLFRPDNQQFLNLSRSTPIVRYIESPQPNQAVPLQGKLKVLVIIATPKGVAELDLAKERKNIEKTFADQSEVDVDILTNPTAERLQEKLSSAGYHVLHFMGHGAHDPNTGMGALILEDENGDAKPYDAVQLGVALGDERRTLRLVFLNACDTAKSTESDDSAPFGGVAASLVQSGVTAVLAMQFPISDRAAIAFSRRFYRCIANGFAVDHAVAEGRKAIINDNGASMEWGTPVLFMRTPDGHLFDTPAPPAAPIPEPLPSAATPTGPASVSSDASTARSSPAAPAKAAPKRLIIGAVAAVALVAAVIFAALTFMGKSAYQFESENLAAFIGAEAKVRLLMAGDSPSDDDMRAHRVTFENKSPGVIELGEEMCGGVCIINGAWENTLTGLDEGNAIVLAHVTVPGQDDPISPPYLLSVTVQTDPAVTTKVNAALATVTNAKVDTADALVQLADASKLGIKPARRAAINQKIAALERVAAARQVALDSHGNADLMLSEKFAAFEAWQKALEDEREITINALSGDGLVALYDTLNSHTRANKFVLCASGGECSGRNRFSRGADVYSFVNYVKPTAGSEKFKVEFWQGDNRLRERTFHSAVNDAGDGIIWDYSTINASGEVEVRLYNGDGDYIAKQSFTM